MATCNDKNSQETIGANPANIHWKVVRGDTSKLRIEFYENDESTYKNTSSWTFAATAHNEVTGNDYDLTVETYSGYVDIVALPADTETWGVTYSSVVAELSFDLEVTIPSTSPGADDVVWTPVIGTISVLGDVTRGGL